MNFPIGNFHIGEISFVEMLFGELMQYRDEKVPEVIDFRPCCARFVVQTIVVVLT